MYVWYIQSSNTFYRYKTLDDSFVEKTLKKNDIFLEVIFSFCIQCHLSAHATNEHVKTFFSK